MGPSTGNYRAQARTRIQLTSEGKILVAQNDALFRFEQDGQPDQTFNGTGRLNLSGSIASIAVAENGTITVCGSQAGGVGFITRLTVAGTPDKDFEGGGTIILRLLTTDTFVRSLMLHSDGSFVIAGEVDTLPNDIWGTGRRGMLAAFTPEGQLDPEFNGHQPLVTHLDLTDGCTWFDLGGNFNDGLVVVGSTGRIASERPLVCRFLKDGKQDKTFGNGEGYVIRNTGHGMEWISTAVQPDKRIVVSRYSINPDLGALVSRYVG